MESISLLTHTLKEIENLNLHDFGIYLELEPDEEEKAQLEQNIQIALQSGGIDLDDAIDIRQIKNLKLANQLLKIKKEKETRSCSKSSNGQHSSAGTSKRSDSRKAACLKFKNNRLLLKKKLVLSKQNLNLRFKECKQRLKLKNN
jgi:hypothetical protein